MRINEIEIIKPKPPKAPKLPKPPSPITKLEDPLKRQADKLKDKADQLTDQSTERKNIEDVNDARDNLRDKERRLAGDVPKRSENAALRND